MHTSLRPVGILLTLSLRDESAISDITRLCMYFGRRRKCVIAQTAGAKRAAMQHMRDVFLDLRRDKSSDLTSLFRCLNLNVTCRVTEYPDFTRSESHDRQIRPAGRENGTDIIIFGSENLASSASALSHSLFSPSRPRPRHNALLASIPERPATRRPLIS